MTLHLKDGSIILDTRLVPFSELLQQQQEQQSDTYMTVVDKSTWELLSSFYQHLDFSPLSALPGKVTSNNLPYHFGDLLPHIRTHYFEGDTVDIHKVADCLKSAYKLDFQEYKKFLQSLMAVVYWEPQDQKVVKTQEKMKGNGPSEQSEMYQEKQLEQTGVFLAVNTRTQTRVTDIAEEVI